MFKVTEYCTGSYQIINGDKRLHSDGSIYETTEYWPTRELAQAVLDKYQPVPKHVWKHGDVFKTPGYLIMMFVKTHDKPAKVIYLNDDMNATCKTQEYLGNATFLFNIREKL